LLILGAVVGLLSCGEPTGGGPPVPASLSIITGNTQTDTIGAHLATPLGVRVLTATGAPVPNATVQFAASGNGSVAPTAATTDANGLASATWTLRTLVGPDTVRATVAALAGQEAVFTAVVNPGRLAHLTLTPDTVRFFKLQDTTKVLVAGTDRALNPVVLGALQWSTALPGIATITQTGVVQSVARGRTTASAQDPTTGVVDTTRVVVSQTPLDIAVQPGTDTLNWLNETLQLAATAHDSGGYTITGVPFTWQSLDSAIALVDTVGKVTAVTAGTAHIRVSYLGVADTAAILVRQIPASVTIAVSDTLAAFSDTAAAAGIAQDSGGALISGTILNWSSSNSGIAEVLAPKVIVARGNGSAIIQATLGSLQDTEVVVVRQRAVDVQVQPPSATLAIGASTQFHAIAYDRHGFAIDSAVVPLTGVWRPLNVNWVTVSQTGFATARAAGVAGVVFKQDTTADSAVVTVTAPILGLVTSWEWKNPLPQANTLNGVSGNADNNIYAVGVSGTIVHFNGSTWTPKPRVDIPVLNDVWVSPTGQVFASGGDAVGHGLVLRGYDPWTIDTIPPFGFVRAIWGVTDTSVFAVNDIYRVMKFDGTAWSEIGALPLNGVQDIEGVSSQLLYVSGSVLAASNDTGVIYRYNGATWTEVYRGFVSVMSVWVAPDSSVYALGRGTNCASSLLHSNGVAWDTVASFTDDIIKLNGRTEQDIYATGSCNGFEAIVHWDGVSWTSDRRPTENAPQSLWASPSGTWVAAGGFGSIQTNTGSGWSTVTSGLRGQQYNIRAMEMWAPSDTAYITGHDSRILRWDGAALTEVVTPFSGVPSPISGYQRPLEGIWGSSSSDMYVGGGFQNACFTPPTGCDGILAHFNGTSWQVIYNQGIVIHTIWGTAPDDIFAVGHHAGLHFDGTSWSRTGQGVFDTDQIRAVWGYRSDDVWACGENRDVYHYDGQNWSTTAFTVACGSLIGFASNDIYMVGSSNGSSGTVNTIAHYNGVSWSVVYTGGGPGADYTEASAWGSGPNDVHAAFGNAYVRFDGNAWQAQPLPPMSPITIRGDSRGHILGAGEVAGLVVGHQ